jgi:hypothetical protein
MTLGTTTSTCAIDSMKPLGCSEVAFYMWSDFINHWKPRSDPTQICPRRGPGKNEEHLGVPKMNGQEELYEFEKVTHSAF